MGAPPAPKRTVDCEEILKLKAQGHSLRRIATALGAGYGTVRTRLQRVS
jgi:DNA-binding CsgD family transcriptional regulator